MTKILVIEDEEPVRANILDMLEAEEMIGMGAQDGDIGIQMARSLLPDLILCDIMMPGRDGYEVLKELRSHGPTASIPFIFLTAKASKADLRAGMNLGADDYLTKPFSRDELLGAIAARLQKREEVISHYIAELTEAQKELNKVAGYDPITKLPNRLQLQERFDRLRSEVQRVTQIPILVLSLDRFSRINDAFGHGFGEFVLLTVADRLKQEPFSHNTIAHFSAEQFALIVSPEYSITAVAQTLLETFKQPFIESNNEIIITASIGIALYPKHGRDLDTLIKHADYACNQVQTQGGNQYRFYHQDMISASSFDKLALETSLRHALNDLSQMQVHYQPQVNLKTGQIIGAEALVRWYHPERGAISPSEFIPLAEETGLIIPLGEWVLRTAMQEAQKWQVSPPIRIAVNLSGRQFQQPGFQQVLLNILQATGFNPKYLELEITESVLLQDIAATMQIIKQLKTLGIEISLDDFGTGFSSLSYLKQFPFDTLKIDQCFIRNLGADARDSAIVIAIVQMAHSLNLKVIAEGVETESELAVLRENHCDAIQGYLFSPPVSAQEFQVLLNSR
ncbi:MAG: EAL domain-containing protein [Hormoscilla sp.]